MPRLADAHFEYNNTLQHTATHCNTLQHTATHFNTLQHAGNPHAAPRRRAFFRRPNTCGRWSKDKSDLLGGAAPKSRISYALVAAWRGSKRARAACARALSPHDLCAVAEQIQMGVTRHGERDAREERAVHHTFRPRVLTANEEAPHFDGGGKPQRYIR